MSASPISLARKTRRAGRVSPGWLGGSNQVLGTAFLFLISIYFLAPAWWLLVASTKSESGLYQGNGFWFSQINFLANAKELFQFENGVFLRWMLNTALYAIVGAAVATLLSAAAGYVLAKLPFRRSEGVFLFILAGVLIPGPLVALPLYLLFSAVHLVNTVWAVFLPSIVSPFGVYLARVYADKSIPDEVIDAARMDGAGEIKIFYRVGLRLMTPALVTIFLFQFVGIWNNYFLPLLMLTNNHLWPLTVGLAYLQGQNNQAFLHLVVTGSLFSVLPLVVAFLLLQRYWRSGLAAGAVTL